MREGKCEVGICGTFDVANYGDLLFPLIAERELEERLGPVNLRRFSYHAKRAPEWPFEVTPLSALPEMITGLDGLLIGGGFVIRFDKDVAPGYAPPTPEIHHPTGYWLSPSLLALQHDVPLVWNAVGVVGGGIPGWANLLVKAVLNLGQYISVRDEASRTDLASIADAPVAVVPDTAFGLSRLVNFQGAPSADFSALRQACGLDGPYVVVQAGEAMAGFAGFLRQRADRFGNLRFLALPIGPCLGDEECWLDGVPGVVRLPCWPAPLLTAELIGRAEAVVGHSYHLCITALTAGVPVFIHHAMPARRYSVLQQFDTLFELPLDGQPDTCWFAARIGRNGTAPAAGALCESLRGHWDRIADAIRGQRQATSVALGRLWQSLPTVLESAAREDIFPIGFFEARSAKEARLAEVHAARSEAAEGQRRLQEAQDELTAVRQVLDDRRGLADELRRELSVERANAAAGEARLSEIRSSISWKLTAPLRLAGGLLMRRRMLTPGYIARHRIESYPYRWAAVNDLFRREDALELVETYPLDHFKPMSAHGADRQWEYDVRSLIDMGAGRISFPEDLSMAWRALAMDLLSPEYRAAMSALTGCDLRQASLEVNVFHYGAGGLQSPHQDLPDKIVTHVLYFNRAWNGADGGCLRILRSPDPEDAAFEVTPIVGRSCVIVRSDDSWHAVSRVTGKPNCSRRAVTVTFYRASSVSTMWPPGDTTPLRRYRDVESNAAVAMSAT